MFVESFLVNSPDVTGFGVMRFSSMARAFQIAAEHDMDRLGAGTRDVSKTGLIWMLASQKIRVARMPGHGERFRIETHLGKVRHGIYPRFHRAVAEASGELLAEGAASWILADRVSRKYVTGEKCPDVSGGAIETDSSLHVGIRQTELRNFEVIRVPYSVTDINGHMNNSAYFDLCEDRMPETEIGLYPREMRITYRKEILPGELLTLKWGREDDMIYFCGETDVPCFAMNVQY